MSDSLISPSHIDPLGRRLRLKKLTMGMLHSRTIVQVRSLSLSFGFARGHLSTLLLDGRDGGDGIRSCCCRRIRDSKRFFVRSESKRRRLRRWRQCVYDRPKSCERSTLSLARTRSWLSLVVPIVRSDRLVLVSCTVSIRTSTPSRHRSCKRLAST